jgi:hypothetical protein
MPILDQVATNPTVLPRVEGLRRLPPVVAQLPTWAGRRLTVSRISASADDSSKVVQTASIGATVASVRFADWAGESDADHVPGAASVDGSPRSLKFKIAAQQPPVKLAWTVNNALPAIRISDQTDETHASAGVGEGVPVLATPAVAGTAARESAEPIADLPAAAPSVEMKMETDAAAPQIQQPIAGNAPLPDAETELHRDKPLPTKDKDAVAFRRPTEATSDDPQQTADAPLSADRLALGTGGGAGALPNLVITDPFSLPQTAVDFQIAREISTEADSVGVRATGNETPIFAASPVVIPAIQQPGPLHTAQNQRGLETILAPQSPRRTESDPITLHLKNVDIRQVLEMLSREHGLNILVAPGVTGAVTANLIAVDRDEALSAILKLCNLVATREGDLTYVYAPTELPMADATVQIFPLDYSKGEDTLPSVERLLSPSGRAFLSASDELDNRRLKEVIVVVDYPEAQDRVARYLAELDHPPAQVLIEAHVLAVELGEDCQFGINYERLFSLGDTDVEFRVAGFADDTTSPGVFAHLSGSDVDTLLECLKTNNDAKVLASPRVMVLNEQKASIQIGEQLGYKVVTVTEVAAVEEVKFLDVGVVLEVTPRITRDGRVLMRVKPEVSSGLINPETLLPEEDTTEVETNVFLENGEAVVIGGLIQEKDATSRNVIPFLGELRFIGKLFRHTVVEKERREIIITLVPRIVEPRGCQEVRELVNVEQSVTPLFEGPLLPHPRPWEPEFPDSKRFLGRHCGGRLCGRKRCNCRCHQCQHIAPVADAAYQGEEVHDIVDESKPISPSGPDISR